jgi:acyl-CoA hydrolase
VSDLQTTEHGIPIDPAFAEPASEDQLQLAATSLRSRGIDVSIVDTAADARALVHDLVEPGRDVFTARSETLRLSGIDTDIDQSDTYRSTRAALAAMDHATQGDDMRRSLTAPDVVIGSVHAISEDGHVVIGSMTGSQLAPYAAGAAKVVWIVGAQKVVPDLETALRRLDTYSYPMEDTRIRAAYGIPSSVNKVLIVSREPVPGRISVVLVRDAIGF